MRWVHTSHSTLRSRSNDPVLVVLEDMQLFSNTATSRGKRPVASFRGLRGSILPYDRRARRATLTGHVLKMRSDYCDRILRLTCLSTPYRKGHSFLYLADFRVRASQSESLQERLSASPLPVGS